MVEVVTHAGASSRPLAAALLTGFAGIVLIVFCECERDRERVGDTALVFLSLAPTTDDADATHCV